MPVSVLCSRRPHARKHAPSTAAMRPTRAGLARSIGLKSEGERTNSGGSIIKSARSECAGAPVAYQLQRVVMRAIRDPPHRLLSGRGAGRRASSEGALVSARRGRRTLPSSPVRREEVISKLGRSIDIDAPHGPCHREEKLNGAEWRLDR